MLFKLRAALAFGLGFLAVAAGAQTLNVGPGQQYTTIQSAINAAKDGYTVSVAPGIYYENVNFFGKQLTLTSTGDVAHTIIDGGSAGPGVNLTGTATHPLGTHATVVNGFTIQNGGSEPSTQPTGGIVIEGGNNGFTISNNILTHNHCAGIYENFTPETISGNEIDNTLDNGGDCFKGGGSAILLTSTFQGTVNPETELTLITGNTIQNNVQGGQEGIGSGGITDLLIQATIQFNTFSGNSTQAVGGALYLGNMFAGTNVLDNLITGNIAACGGGAIASARALSAGNGPEIFANNTIVNNVDSGPICTTSVSGNASQILFADEGSHQYQEILVNNIVSSTERNVPAIACAQTSDNPASGYNTPIFDHNLFYDTGFAVFDKSCTDPTGLYGNQTADPQFTSGGFTLQPSSPAIDAGNTSQIYDELDFFRLSGIDTTHDIAGNLRVADATGKGYAIVDIGAYEAAGAADQQATALILQPSNSPNSASFFYNASGGDTVGLNTTAVCASGGSIGAQGPISFFEDGASIGSANLASYTGIATLATVFLAPGVQHFTATYAGQPSCFPGVSTQIVYFVANYTPQLTLTSSLNPALQGQAVTFNLTLTSADPSQAGPVVLSNNGTPLTTLALTPGPSGTATGSFTTSGLPLGANAITAAYAGDATHNAASASLTEYIVNGAITTSTTINSSENPSSFGDNITLYANVTSPDGPPTGTVTFSEGSTVYATQSLNYGSAQFSLSTLALGAHTITATYTPTGLYNASSGSFVQHVATGTATTLAVTAAGVVVTTVPSGTTVTLTAAVKAGTTPVTPGQVNFCNAAAANCTDVNLLGVAQLTAAGTATLNFRPGIGKHQYQAVFAGTNIDTSSASNTAPLTVTGIEPTITQLTATGIPGDYTLTANVFALGGVLPTGSIPFLDTTNANYQLATAPLGTGALSLFNASTPTLPTSGYGVALADMNGDGIPDLLATSGDSAQDSGNGLQVLLGNGDGTFTLKSSTPTGDGPNNIAVGDFNHDGIPDAAVVNELSASVTVLLGNGDGTFTPAPTLNLPAVHVYGITVGDFNGDGVQDLAVTDYGSPNVFILLGNGDGTFQSPTTVSLPLAYQPTAIVAADFNGDGKIDLAVGDAVNPAISILLGNGDGTFNVQASTSALAFQAYSLAVADFNSDGIPDLVAVANGAYSTDNQTTVLLGNGDGTFTVSQNIATGPSSPVAERTAAVAVGDFNADGVPDFAVTTTNVFTGGAAGNTVTLYLGKDDGTFTASAQAQTGVDPRNLAVADINGDGLSDLVTQNALASDLSVFLTGNQATATVTNISPIGTGTHYADASYPGNATTAASVSNLVPLLAQPQPTASILTANPTTSNQNQPVTFTATISPGTAQNHTPTGMVTFSFGATQTSAVPLGTAPVINDTATLTYAMLPAGADSVYCIYSGDTNFATSECNAVTEQVVGNQTITFPQPTEPAYAGTSVLLTASTNAGLPVTYTVLSGPAYISTLNGSVLTYTGAGTVVVEADQPGSSSYSPASPMQVSVATTVLTEAVGSSIDVATVMVATTGGEVAAVNYLTQGAPNLDFTDPPRPGCNLGTTYAAGATCPVTFTFTPTRPGLRNGAITLTDTNGNLLATSNIYGIGTGPQVNWTPAAAKVLVSGPSGRPADVIVDPAGNIFYCDTQNSTVVELTAASNHATAVNIGSGFDDPVGLAMDGSGNIFVADYSGNQVQEVLAAGGYKTVLTVGSGFSAPAAVAVDGNGDLFIADHGNSAVKELTATSGYTTVVTLGSGFLQPGGVAVDASGNLFVADEYHNRVVELTAASGYATETTIGSGFNQPSALALDGEANLFVADEGNDAFKKVLAQGGYTTIQTIVSGLFNIGGISVDGLGNVYYIGYGNSTLYELDYVDPPTLTFANTAVGHTSTDSPQTVTLLNNGNAPLSVSAASPTNPSITPGFTFTSTCDVTAAYTVAPGATCTDAVSFTPVNGGQDNGALTTADNNLNALAASQTVLLNGNSPQIVPTVQLTASPMASTAGETVILNALVSSSSSQTPTGTVTFFYGTMDFGTGTLTNGVASLATAMLPTGADCLTAFYPGDADFTSATSGPVCIVVSPAGSGSQTITFPPPLEPAYAGTSVLLAAFATSGLPITYTVISGPATVSGSILNYIGAGTVVVEADQPGNATYSPATEKQQTVTVTLLTAPVGTTSAIVSTIVTITNPGALSAIAVLTQGAPNLDFKLAPGSTCTLGVTYAAGQDCAINFTFTPSLPGLRFGGITLTDASGNLIANSYIYGLGVAPEIIWSPGNQTNIGSGFTSPSGVAVDGKGNTFVADYDAGTLTEILPSGFMLPLGSYPLATDVAVDGSGNVFVTTRTTLSEILASTIPANPLPRLLATFPNADINGMSVDVFGDAFIATGAAGGADGSVQEVLAVNGIIPASPTIRSLPLFVTTLGATATGAAVDPAGNVYYSDEINNAAYEILAVNGVIPANATVLQLAANLAGPTNIAIDAAGNVYVSEYYNVQELLAVNGVLPANPAIQSLGTGLAAIITSSVTVDDRGNVYITGYDLPSVIELGFGSPPTLNFAATPVNTTSPDSPRTVTLTNDGNAQLIFRPMVVPGIITDPTITPGFTFISPCPTLSSLKAMTFALNPGGVCTYAVSFKPVTPGANTGALSITDNNLSAPNSTQIVPLNGTATAPAPTIVFTVPNHTFGDAPFAVMATSNSTGAFTYSVVSGPATIAGNIVTLTGAGTVTLLASEAATSLFSAGSAQAIFQVAKEPQTITFPAPASPLNFGAAPITLTATASSGLPVVFSVLSGPATINGATVTFTGAGTVTVAADQPGNANFAAAPEVTHIIRVNGQTAGITITAAPNPVFLQNPVTLTATLSATAGTPTGTVMFLDVTNPAAPVPLGTATLSTAATASLTTTTLALGVHSITASYAGDNNFNPAVSAPVLVTVEDFSLTLTNPSLTIIHGGTATYNLVLGAVGGPGMASAITFSAIGQPQGSTVTFTPSTVPTGAGTTPVTLIIQTPNYPTGPFSLNAPPASRITLAFLAFGALSLGGLLLPYRRTRRALARHRRLATILLLLAAATSLTACGSGWRTQGFAVTITATSGNLTRTATAILTSECRNQQTACPIEQP